MYTTLFYQFVQIVNTFQYTKYLVIECELHHNQYIKDPTSYNAITLNTTGGNDSNRIPLIKYMQLSIIYNLIQVRGSNLGTKQIMHKILRTQRSDQSKLHALISLV